MYGRWRVIGREKIPRSGPVIVASNHVSFLDPPLVGAAIRRECAFMARHDLFHHPVFRWYLPKLGAFPIHREVADRSGLKLALEALKRERVLVLFPEGTRSIDGKLQRGEAGVALLVQKSGAPVVPAAVIGPEEMLPVDATRLKRTRVRCIFGEPLRFEPNTPREEIVTAIMRAIAALLTENGVPTTAVEDVEAVLSAEC
jgi:1-acyl-sn-glycerol-3-phosphate acyltransferase